MLQSPIVKIKKLNENKMDIKLEQIELGELYCSSAKLDSEEYNLYRNQSVEQLLRNPLGIAVTFIPKEQRLLLEVSGKRGEFSRARALYDLGIRSLSNEDFSLVEINRLSLRGKKYDCSKLKDVPIVSHEEYERYSEEMFNEVKM